MLPLGAPADDAVPDSVLAQYWNKTFLFAHTAHFLVDSGLFLTHPQALSKTRRRDPGRLTAAVRIPLLCAAIRRWQLGYGRSGLLACRMPVDILHYRRVWRIGKYFLFDAIMHLPSKKLEEHLA